MAEADDPASLCGAPVVIDQLVQRKDLNGRVGTAGEYDEAKQRLKVHVLCTESVCCVLLLRPLCITRASEEQAAEDAKATRMAIDQEVSKLPLSASPGAELATLSSIGDLAEKVSVAENHACEPDSPLLATKRRAIAAMLATLRVPDVAAATEWRSLRALRFLVRGDALAIAAACERPGDAAVPVATAAAAAAPAAAAPAPALTAQPLSGPALGVAALNSASRYLQLSASGAFNGSSEGPAAAEAERAKLRWAADMLKALSWDDEGARQCHRAEGAAALAQAMRVGARWVEVQLACVVAVRNLVAHPPALRALAAECGPESRTVAATAASTGWRGAPEHTTLARVVAALNLFPTHSELASYGCELLALVALNGLCPCCGGACGDASDVRVELDLRTSRWPPAAVADNAAAENAAAENAGGGAHALSSSSSGGAHALSSSSSGGGVSGNSSSNSSSGGDGGGSGDGGGVDAAGTAGAAVRVGTSLEVLSVSSGAAAGREAVIAASGLQAVARVIHRCTDKHVCRDALRAMMALASGEQAIKVLRSGGLDTTLAALGQFPDDQECATLGLTALRELAIDHAHLMRTPAVIAAAKRSLERFPDVEDIACRALGLLTNLANDPEPMLAQPRLQLCAAGVLPLVVGALRRFEHDSAATCPALMVLTHLSNSLSGTLSDHVLRAGALDAVLEKIDDLCAHSTDRRNEPDDRSDEPTFYALGTVVGLSEGARAADCWRAGAHLAALRVLDAFAIDSDSCGAALRALVSMVRACEEGEGGSGPDGGPDVGGAVGGAHRRPGGGGGGGGNRPRSEAADAVGLDELDGPAGGGPAIGQGGGGGGEGRHTSHLPRQSSSVAMPEPSELPWGRIADAAVRVLNECIADGMCERQTEEAAGLLASLASAGSHAHDALMGSGAAAAAATAVHTFPDDLGVLRNSWRTLSRLAAHGDTEQRLAVRRAAEEAKASTPAKTGATGTTAPTSSSGGSTPGSASSDEDAAAGRRPTGAPSHKASPPPPRPPLGATMECAICLTAPAAPDAESFVQFECGHAFCEGCVAMHVQSKLAGKERHCRCAQCSEAAHPECPLCRRPLGPTGILAAALHVPSEEPPEE